MWANGRANNEMEVTLGTRGNFGLLPFTTPCGHSSLVTFNKGVPKAPHFYRYIAMNKKNL